MGITRYEGRDLAMAARNIRMGLIGAGRIGIVHSGSINDTKGVDLAWISDPMVEAAEKLGAQYGAKVTADPYEIINSGDVDAILIASPTATHVELLEAGIDAGLHVMCEKPIDLDIKRVDALRAKANAAQTKVALGFNRRFHPQFETINKRVKAGEIGNLEQLIILSRDPAPAPKAYLAGSGGIFRDMTIHDFDMARYFVPEIVEVTAVGANVFSDDIREIGDYDSVNITLRGSKGELVTIVNSRHASYGYDQRLEAFGSDGMLYAKNMTPTTVEHYSAEHTEQREPYLNFFLELYAHSYRRELALFVESIHEGTVLCPTYEDGRAALVLADAALESAQTGKSVKVSL